MSSPAEVPPPKKTKRVQAPRAAVWGVFALVGLGLEFVGLHRANGWGPLSNAVWVITDSGPHGILWWFIPSLLLWLTAHFMYPGVAAFGWRGLLWFIATGVFMWATGRYLFRII